MLLIIMMLLTACGQDSSVPKQADTLTNNEDNMLSPSAKVSDLRVEIREGDFLLAIYSEKSQYKLNEPISVYAELMYTGDEKEVTISHAMSPIGFGTEETTRNYPSTSIMDQPLVHTTLKQNEPLKIDYSFSGWYSSSDKQEYIDFITSLSNKVYPQGHYKITARASFTNESVTPAKDYGFHTVVEFDVVE